jgi:SAM-dependent methyltransferase
MGNSAVTRYLHDTWQFAGELGRRPPLRRAALVGRWTAAAASERILDRHFAARGLATSGRDPGHYGPSGLQYGYVPTPWLALLRMFPPGSLGADDAVLEYGCGKGRAVAFLSSRFPCRVTGVEIDPGLCADAEANLAHVRQRGRAEILRADAAALEVPGDVTVAYLYNPFRGQVFGAVLDRLRESLERTPRPLRVVYYHPLMHDALIGAGFTPVRHEVNRSWGVREHPSGEPGPAWMPPYAWAEYRAGSYPGPQRDRPVRR